MRRWTSSGGGGAGTGPDDQAVEEMEKTDTGNNTSRKRREKKNRKEMVMAMLGEYVLVVMMVREVKRVRAARRQHRHTGEKKKDPGGNGMQEWKQGRQWEWLWLGGRWKWLWRDTSKRRVLYFTGRGAAQWEKCPLDAAPHKRKNERETRREVNFWWRGILIFFCMSSSRIDRRKFNRRKAG